MKKADREPHVHKDQDHTHQSHPAIIKRLRRAEGHLRSVIAMIEDGKPCVDVAPQLQAVEQAISKAKIEFIRDHIDHCIGGSKPDAARSFVEELKVITKYL